jgi:hypothetical protein
VLRPASASDADFTLSTTAMTARGATVNMTIRYFDGYGNLTDFDGDIIAQNQQLPTTITEQATRQPSGVYTLRLTVVEPGQYLLSSRNTIRSLQVRGRTKFNINPGMAERAIFDGVPNAVLVGQEMTGVAVQFLDRLGAPTNHWSGNARLSGPEIKPVSFLMRDSLGVMHSGWFDLDSSTVLNTIGRYSFVAYDTVGTELRMSGVRGFNVTTLPFFAHISIGTTTPDSTTTAGVSLPITVQFRDSLGNVADILTPVRLYGSTSAFVPAADNSTLARLLTRTLVGGLPEYRTTIVPSTTGIYRFAIDTLTGINRRPVGRGQTQLIVLSGAPLRAEILLSAPSVAMNADLCATLIFRDALGNLTDTRDGVGANLSFSYITGAISATGTFPIQTRTRQGFYEVCPMRFAQPNINANHVYTLSVDGITQANTRGQRTFQVLNPVPVLHGITPEEFREDCGSGFAIMQLEKGGASSHSAATTASEPVPGIAPSRLVGETPSTFTLFPAAPNPFVHTTKLRYELAADAHIRLNIFDMNGNQISEIASVEQTSGYYELEWIPPAELPSGTYMIVLTARTAKGQVLQRGTAVQRIK